MRLLQVKKKVRSRSLMERQHDPPFGLNYRFPQLELLLEPLELAPSLSDAPSRHSRASPQRAR